MTEPTTLNHDTPSIDYPDDLACPECNYSLRGINSTNCPECGLDLGFIDSQVSIIPWAHRRELGWFNAYWRTVALVVFKHKRFCRALYQPVDEKSAHWFRGLSIAHVMIPLCILAAVFHLTPSDLRDLALPFIGPWLIGLPQESWTQG